MNEFHIFTILQKKIKNTKKKRLKNNQKRFITVSETFGSIKEIKVGGLEKIYNNHFYNKSNRKRNQNDI
jgi:ABC-type bacteriocin/lantibiotic exporter with double-glycine peptidase domain